MCKSTACWIHGILLVAVFLQLSHAARRVNLQHHISKRSVHFRRSSPDHILGLQTGEHLQPSNKVRTAKGTTKVKMQETYQGVPVVGESVVIEMDDNGHYTGVVSGQLLEGINEDISTTEPQISAEQALEYALEYSGDSRANIHFNPGKDALLEIDVKGQIDVRPRLVYNLNYRVEERGHVSRPTFIIDANTGRVLKQWDGMTMASWRKRSKRNVNPITAYELVDGVGGNEKIGKYVYGLDLPSLKVTVGQDGRCVLENQYALVYNCNESYDCSLEGAEPHHFDCEQGNNDTVNEGYSPLNDALFYVGLTYEMYAEWYEISDILQNKDLNGGRCPTRVHYGHLYENAFWDGDVITFGDGESMMYPLTSLNVVAHEISHGFTERNGGLIYAGESGGMNEAFSDMAGEAAEDFLKHKIDWMVGFAIWKKKNESMRYFDDPPKDGRSIDHYEDFCFDMDPHLSSGIYNRAFYILSNRPGWCVRKAFHIFVVANDLYWRPNSNFHDAACDVQRAADDLGYNVNDVTYAFRQVGIEPCSKKGQNDLGTPLMLRNESSMTFKLNNNLDEELDYNNLLLMVMGSEPVMLTAKTEDHIFTVQPTEDNQYDANIALDLGRRCFKSDCEFSVSTDVETMAMIVPIAQFHTLVAGITLHGEEPDYSYDEPDTNTTDAAADNSTYTIAFEMPEVILKNKLRAVFSGTSMPRQRGSFYIRHLEPPNLKAHEADMSGRLNEDPALLCKPRAGTYYLTVQANSEEVKSISIVLGTWMKGDLINVPETSSASPS